MIQKIDSSINLNCSIFNAYEYNDLSLNELLCTFFTKINECIEQSNKGYTFLEWLYSVGLSKEVSKKLEEWLYDGTIESIINNDIFSELNEKIETMNAKFNNEINKINNYINTFYVNLFEEGCKIDGITNDSIAFQKALNKGNIKLPMNSRIKLSGINIPNNRVIDLNGSTIVVDGGNLFSVGSLTNDFYTGYFTIRNGYVETQTKGDIITIYNSIRFNIQSLKLNVLNNETTFIKIVNGFNFIVDDIWCGNGLTEKSVNSCAIDISCNTLGKPGINNITNSRIINSLIQNMEYGIKLNGNNGSIDTFEFDNIGFSKCTKGISIIGIPGNVKTISVNNTRYEFCGIGIDNNGITEINNCRIYESEQGVNNNSNGRITLLGNIDILNKTTKKGIVNKGYLYINTTNIAFNDLTKFELGVHTRIYDPLILKHKGRDFNDVINPIYNRIIFQQDYFELSDLPTLNIPNQTELTFYSSGNWNLKIDENLFYKGFKFGCIKLIFIDKWLVIGDSTLEKN